MSLERVQAELAGVERLLAELPSDFKLERAGLESMRAELQAELERELRREDRDPVAELAFEGSPVVDRDGIDARFASDALKEFEKLVERLVPEQGEANKKQRGRLLITDTARGSFGFVFGADSPALIDSSRWAVALRKAAWLLQAASFDDEHPLLQALADENKPTAVALRNFLKVAKEGGAGLKFRVGHAALHVSRAGVSDARKRLEALTIEEVSHQIEGVFLGATLDSRRFDFDDTESHRVIKGQLVDSFPAGVAAAYFNKPCVAVLVERIAERAGRTARSWVLLELRPPP